MPPWEWAFNIYIRFIVLILVTVGTLVTSAAWYSAMDNFMLYILAWIFGISFVVTLALFVKYLHEH